MARSFVSIVPNCGGDRYQLQIGKWLRLFYQRWVFNRLRLPKATRAWQFPVHARMQRGNTRENPGGGLLTFRATISHGLSQGWIELFDVPDWESRMAVRPLYVTPGFWTWIDNTPELHEPLKALGSRSIFEQIELMLIDFRCSDRPPGASELRRMVPTKHGIWKAHPPGARLFGWVPEPGSLVVVSGDREAVIKTNRPLYAQHLQGVRDFRKLHGLESWIVRGDYRAIFPS